MNKLLAIAVLLALLYISRIQGKRVKGLTCNYCRKVEPNNACRHRLRTCRAGRNKFCYSRLTVKGGHLQHVEFGCSATCRTIRYRNAPHKIEHYMLCCDKDLCNNHKFWAQKH